MLAEYLKAVDYGTLTDAIDAVSFTSWNLVLRPRAEEPGGRGIL